MLARALLGAAVGVLTVPDASPAAIARRKRRDRNKLRAKRTRLRRERRR